MLQGCVNTFQASAKESIMFFKKISFTTFLNAKVDKHETFTSLSCL